MQNLGMILRVARTIAPGLDVKAVGTEIRERIHEELDYELEAANQRTMARLYRDHPFIHVPEVVTSLCRERVLVNEFVEGVGFEDVKTRDQATRDRVGEIVFRFYFGSMYRHGQFSGDPHPGNFLLRPDDTVAFLDFGLFKHLPRELVDVELAALRAGARPRRRRAVRPVDADGPAAQGRARSTPRARSTSSSTRPGGTSPTRRSRSTPTSPRR